MDKSQIDQKAIVREVVGDYLRDNAPVELDSFELAFEGMYQVMQPDPPSAVQKAEGPGLSGAQFVDATIIAAGLWAAKSMFWFIADPLLEEKLLPSLDHIEEGLGRSLKRPELVHSIRTLLERAVRKRLGKPAQ